MPSRSDGSTPASAITIDRHSAHPAAWSSSAACSSASKSPAVNAVRVSSVGQVTLARRRTRGATGQPALSSVGGGSRQRRSRACCPLSCRRTGGVGRARGGAARGGSRTPREPRLWLDRDTRRGALALFVRTTAVRLAVDAHRKTRREVELGEMLAAPLDDPELEYMRKLYADNLVAAAREAWTRLAGHERFLLALRIYDQMSVDDLARVYQIHRASAARRAAAARAAFVGHVRAALRAKLAVGDSTLDSILRIVTTSVQLPLDEAFTSE